MMIRRLLLTSLCLLLSQELVAASVPADPVYLSGLRVQPGQTESHFIFMLSKKTAGRVRYDPQKKIVSVLFTNTRMQFRIENVKLRSANVEVISAEVEGNNIKITFMVKEPIKWHSTFLPVDKHGGAQLKLDIISIPNQSVPAKQKHVTLQQQFAKDLEKRFSDFTHEARKTKDKHTVFYPIEPEPEKKLAAIIKQNEKKPVTFTIVIDAGHGGKDTGAIGRGGILEKNIVLNIAKFLAEKINSQPHYRAVLTRSGDYYVPLRGRLKLARKGDADLFIAIHADAYFNTVATGASVYALSQRGATTEAARWLAMKDNYSELSDVALNHLQDRSPLLRSVLIDLAQTATIRDSLRLGNKILDTLDDLSSLHYKHVAQAPFVVLKSPDIPSILVETGFISNPKEEKRLADPRYQQKLANAIWQGIDRYAQSTHVFN